mmetsp:Transcript_19974/g.49042  ORF Transcript_19974/g.49042 Transcript_19974/m.49042 type:complete len:271 (+) Transcript_19974:2139-2951(+)
MNPSAVRKMRPSMRLSRCCSGMRGRSHSRNFGTSMIAQLPMPTSRPRATRTGLAKAIAVGFSSASSSLRRTRAMMSSRIAAAITSCPVCVCRTFPAFKTLSAIPTDVGASTVPTTSACIHGRPRADARPIPMARGVSDPSKATATALAPMSLIIFRSTSSPASKTRSSSPTSPISIQLSGFGTTCARFGPMRMPTMTQPTRSGDPIALTAAPPTHTAQSMIMAYRSSSNVKEKSPPPPARSARAWCIKCPPPSVASASMAMVLAGFPRPH